jgi:hypothetical protein
VNWRAVREAIWQAHATDGAAGRTGPVLLSLAIDEEGRIVEAVAIDPPSTPGFDVVAVLIDVEGRQVAMPPAALPSAELKELAVRAIRALQFRPAERAGVPVAFPEYRMTLHVEAKRSVPAA